MKRLKSIENEQVQLEVMECDCGFHLGFDFTYFDQIKDLRFDCPACGRLIDTEKVFAENHILIETWSCFDLQTREYLHSGRNSKTKEKCVEEVWEFWKGGSELAEEEIAQIKDKVVWLEELGFKFEKNRRINGKDTNIL